MPRFEVGASDARVVEVEASNWLSALGDGLVALGMMGGLERLACEVLPNGRVLARNVRDGQGYVVSMLGVEAEGRGPLPPLTGGSRAAGAEPGADAALEADEDEELEDSLTGPGPDRPPDEGRTDLWRGMGRTVGEPTTTTSRVMERLERVRAAPSDLIAWHEALDAAHALVPAEAGAALEREADGRLRFLHAYGPRSAGVQGALMPAGIGIAGFAVERVASLLVTDTRSDPRFCSDFDQVTGFSTHAVICVPVAFEGRVFGCLELLNPLLPGGFDRAQLEVVELVAGALAERLADA
ncbi:GAF domain-containing protein [Myxococcota bacterium]|nr:GAF domain-containing protein [Myxococcota bacterium]